MFDEVLQTKAAQPEHTAPVRSCADGERRPSGAACCCDDAENIVLRLHLIGQCVYDTFMWLV